MSALTRRDGPKPTHMPGSAPIHPKSCGMVGTFQQHLNSRGYCNLVNCRFAGGPAVIELSTYALEVLRKDEDFILYRGRSQGDGCPILVLSPVGEHPTSECLKRLEPEWSGR